jgi:rhodanese-related sulfurtransferase
VDEVSGLIEAKAARAVDANGADTRKQYGTVPGAVLLSNARTFDASELPEDKSTELVFYCGSESCNAAPKAAARAKELGYTAVKVMPEGIRGWVKAGKPVDKLDA